MAEFKEIDAGLKTSARDHHNINEAFFICQKAVTYPISPLYDSKEGNLKPAAVSAFRRIFYLLDRDKDRYLSDAEMQAFQTKCFGKSLSDEDLAFIKHSITAISPSSVTDKGIDSNGFVLLNRFYVVKGRHETVWIILRKFHYSDSLSLSDGFTSPKFDIPANSSTELSPAGYQFLFDLFLLFDKDNDGGLNDAELSALFAPTPGLPSTWIESSFPTCTLRNEAGHVTLQGWLAQWSMTTFKEPRTTLAYLAYLGFEPANSRLTTTAALKTTKARKRSKRPAKVDRNVLQAYIVGASGCGKSTLLDGFLARPFSSTYHPTIKPRTAVNSVELSGGKQCYLILEELGELEPAVLENKVKLDSADLMIYAYDSSDPDSFTHVVGQREKHPHLETLPSLFLALKADNDKTNQRTTLQPEEYATSVGLNKPLHVSVTWSTISDLFVQIAEVALHPNTAYLKSEEDNVDRTNLYIALGAAVCASAAFVGIWRRLLEK